MKPTMPSADSSFRRYSSCSSSSSSSSVFGQPLARDQNMAEKDEDTEALAGFLLSLKHRSVTPEPQTNHHHAAAAQHSSSSSSEASRSLSDCHHSPLQHAGEDRTPPHSPCDMSRIMRGVEPSEHQTEENNQPIDIESLIAGSELVCMEDRDLVPDALFVAMAQMKPCRLQHADRVGCYKTRELGFLGMCCKACGGQPGFGRYYPNSVRSLAQTTTSQTILKHIGSKCRFCPPHVRNAVLELQKLQAAREGLPTGRPRYGSRKIFFQRVWQRLHGEGATSNSSSDGDEKASMSNGSTEEASVDSSQQRERQKRKPKGDDDDNENTPKRKRTKVTRKDPVPSHVSMASASSSSP